MSVCPNRKPTVKPTPIISPPCKPPSTRSGTARRQSPKIACALCTSCRRCTPSVGWARPIASVSTTLWPRLPTKSRFISPVGACGLCPTATTSTWCAKNCSVLPLGGGTILAMTMRMDRSIRQTCTIISSRCRLWPTMPRCPSSWSMGWALCQTPCRRAKSRRQRSSLWPTTRGTMPRSTI